MTKKEKAYLAEGLHRLCADLAAIATLFEEGNSCPNSPPEFPPTILLPEETPTPSAISLPENSPPDSPPTEPKSDPCGPAETVPTVPGPTTPQPDTPLTPEPEPIPETQPEESNDLPAAPAPAKPVTYEDVRAVLAEKSRTGYRAEVKALLTAHGVRQLSEIEDPAIFAQLMQEAEDIGNG